jgi:N-acetyltransferase
MNFPENIVLENERVLLRPLQTDDLENLLPFALNEPDTWQFSLVSATALKGKETQKEFPFIVFDKQANAYAGSTRFYDIDLLNENTQLGYTWYGEAFRRTGLNRHCKLLLLSYAFETWGMNRVEFRAAHSNHKSIAAMKAIGCVEEGILRSHLNWFQGGKRSSMVLSILKEEWENGVKENLIAKTK